MNDVLNRARSHDWWHSDRMLAEDLMFEIQKLRADRSELSERITDLLMPEIKRLQLEARQAEAKLSRQQAEIEQLRELAYAYPPSEPFAIDGVTWQQEAERLLDKLQAHVRLVGELSQKIKDNDAEIKRLRGLLQWWVDAGPDADWDDYEQRVREALDNAP